MLLRAPRPVSAGVASVVVSFFLCTYYNVINAWAFWYLFHSFQVSGRGLQQERGEGRLEGGAGAPAENRGAKTWRPREPEGRGTGTPGLFPERS